VRIRTQLALCYSGILLAGLVLVSGWAYYEVVVEHPAVAKALAKEDTRRWTSIEIMLYGGLPALVIALFGGWILMRRALSPVNTLTATLESIHVDTPGVSFHGAGMATSWIVWRRCSIP
jgi:hypothetical protein